MFGMLQNNHVENIIIFDSYRASLNFKDIYL